MLRPVEQQKSMNTSSRPWHLRLPFYYGWAIVGIAFVTLAIGVTARTAFSLLLPPLLAEFGWDRGLAAGAFSFGFLAFAVISPLVGRAIDQRGPRVVILTGVAMVAAGLLLSLLITRPWHLYATLGLLVGCGTNMMTYTAHSQFLPHWFQRRRALATGIAFSGAGVGALALLPWLQSIIVTDGWRTSCWMMALLAVLILTPLNWFVRGRPSDLGLFPDGVPPAATSASPTAAPQRRLTIVDPAWASVPWTLARAVRTARFWWLWLGYCSVLIAWYAVQVHQTKYVVEIGFSPQLAGWALGLVAVVSIPGQILLGGLSDRWGREWTWTAGCAGFAICYAALIALGHAPSPVLLYVMVVSQGFLGYSITSVMGPIVAEIFEGPQFGAIFGSITAAIFVGGAIGPWAAGAIHDATGSYDLAFAATMACCAVSAGAIWIAAPRKVRLVPGRAPR